MEEIKKPETEQETMERFDSFVRATLLDEGNGLRAEKGYPPLLEDDVADLDTLSALKEKFATEIETTTAYRAV